MQELPRLKNGLVGTLNLDETTHPLSDKVLDRAFAFEVWDVDLPAWAERAARGPGADALPRVLGPVTAAAVVVGTVIGSGVFKKAQTVAANVPEFGLIMLAWALGGLLALAGGLVLAEVATRYPRAGGNYVFLREGYGPGMGFLWGWTELGIIRSASVAALAAVSAMRWRASRSSSLS